VLALDGLRERRGEPVSKSSWRFGADVDGEETEFVREGRGEDEGLPLADGVGDLGGEDVSRRGEGGGVFRLSFMGGAFAGAARESAV
jgi:hypothetical protein